MAAGDVSERRDRKREAEAEGADWVPGARPTAI